MPWIKVSGDPPDFRDWLKCDGCGWLTLSSQPPNVYSCEAGEPCKYCSTLLRPATEQDMKLAYPERQFNWEEPRMACMHDHEGATR